MLTRSLNDPASLGDGHPVSEQYGGVRFQPTMHQQPFLPNAQPAHPPRTPLPAPLLIAQHPPRNGATGRFVQERCGMLSHIRYQRQQAIEKSEN